MYRVLLVPWRRFSSRRAERGRVARGGGGGALGAVRGAGGRRRAGAARVRVRRAAAPPAAAPAAPAAGAARARTPPPGQCELLPVATRRPASPDIYFTWYSAENRI